MGPALQNLQMVDSKLAKLLHHFISNVFIYFLHPSRLLNTCTFSRPTGPSPRSPMKPRVVRDGAETPPPSRRSLLLF